MRRTAVWGAVAGAVFGLVVSLLVGLLLFGTDDIPNIVDRDQLPALYVAIALTGLVVGAALGCGVALIAVRTATNAAGDAAARRRKGTLAAAGVSAALSLLVAPIGPLLLVALAIGALVGGGLAWVALPRLVDLDTPLPGRAVTTPAGRPGADVQARRPLQLSTPRRVVATVLAAGIGGLVGTNVIMTVVAPISSFSRDVEGTLAAGVLAVLAVSLGTLTWRRTGPART